MSQIFGIPATLGAFARLSAEAEVGKKVASLGGAKIVAADMQRRAPVDTGTLQGSITVRPVEDGAAAIALAPYARFVEFGTRYMQAQPFMSEAADEVGNSVAAAMTAVFKRILR